MKQIKGLDTLRALAVFLVIVEHFGVWFDEASPTGSFVKTFLIPDGALGVNLFFVLSGFLITSILLKAKTAPDAQPATIIKSFYARRALRIFPIYYLTLFILVGINYPDVRQYFWYFATYTSNILSYQSGKWNSYSHTWTLSVEEQFYLLWPWLMILVKDKYIKYVLWGALVIGTVTPFLGTATHPHSGPLMVYHSFDAFGLGGLFAWSRITEDRSRNFERTIKILVIPAICIYFYWRYCTFTEHWTIAIVLIKSINSIISMYIIMLVVNNRSERARKYFLENRFLNYIGRISYGIYLYHYPYIMFFKTTVSSTLYFATAHHPTLNKIIDDRHTNYWINVAVVIIVASLSYELIEKPLLRLKKRFNYNGKKTDPAIPAS